MPPAKKQSLQVEADPDAAAYKKRIMDLTRELDLFKGQLDRSNSEMSAYIEKNQELTKSLQHIGPVAASSSGDASSSGGPLAASLIPGPLAVSPRGAASSSGGPMVASSTGVGPNPETLYAEEREREAEVNGSGSCPPGQ